MWKPEHRRAADRTGLRYPSDLSDAEWLHSFGDPCPTGFWEVVQKSSRECCPAAEWSAGQARRVARLARLERSSNNVS
jgi:hypothetical protein